MRISPRQLVFRIALVPMVCASLLAVETSMASPGSETVEPPSFARVSTEAALMAQRRTVERLEERRLAENSEREALEADLDTLSGQIVELKARRSRGLRAEAELGRRLQASRDLSARVDRLARLQEQTTTELATAVTNLIEIYDALFRDARRDMERHQEADEEAKARAALERLAVLETERRELIDGLSRLQGRAELDDGGRPLLMHGIRTRTDDPDELRARADILRDTRDRLEKRLEGLEQKVRTAARQRELEREMDGFFAQSRLFDEGDRAAARVVARARAGNGVDAPESSPPDGYDSGGGEPSLGDGGSDGIDPSFGEDGSWFDGGDDVHVQPELPPLFEEPVRSEPSDGSSDSGRFARIPTRADSSGALDALISADGDSSMNDVEAQKRELERLIRRLERRADDLERRADYFDSVR